MYFGEKVGWFCGITAIAVVAVLVMAGTIKFLLPCEHVGFSLKKNVDGGMVYYRIYKVTTNWPDETVFVTAHIDEALEKLKALNEAKVAEY